MLKELAKIPRSYWFSPPTKSRRGIPDILGCVNGYFIALELKLDGARPDPGRENLQKYELKLMREAGAPVALDRVTPANFDEVLRKLRFLSELQKHNAAMNAL